MKAKVNRFLYFLSSRLQISAAEKTLVLSLGALLLLLNVSQQLVPAGAFVAEDSSYYASRIALFEARAQHVEEELGALQQQYYPGETSRPLSETQTPVAAPPGPEHGAEVEATTRTAPAADMQEAPEETEKININTATSAELESLPGIGPAIAGRIIEHRNTHGPFQRIEDIKNVRGIAEGRFSNIKDLITVGEETPE